jgi:hypothetical protein
MIIDAFAFNLLTLDQATNTNIKGLVVSQFLGVAQIVDQNFEGESARDLLYLSQLVRVVKTLNLGVAHTLAFSQTPRPRVSDEEAFQFLSIQQSVVLESKWPSVTQPLTLTQVAVALLAKAAYNTLTLTQEVTVNVTRNLGVTQTLTMVSQGRAYLPDYYWTSFEITVVAP